jgi:nucleoside-triphosphatase THEP1
MSSEIVKQIQIANKIASPQLSMMMRQAVTEFSDFAGSWTEMIETAKLEGISEKDVIETMKPMIKEELEKRGLTNRQIINKINYLTHQDTIKARRVERYNEQKPSLNSSDLQTNDHCSSKEEVTLYDEIARLRTENNKLQETLENVSFNDNPEVFAVNKNSDTYFANVTVIGARQILSGLDNNKKINFAFEEIEEK